eukprot:TRINITY_DN14088_c0_g2_i1.p1 TRINITY_DN14088_c0_g2~~TRINITY_DN14088_c0_g2_i1.p1  ORF type:complete len:370 (-),score=61.12 TRINITY_DN14088_c0_g2_i1:122-1231(-)
MAARSGVYFCRQAARCVAALPAPAGSEADASGGLRHRFIVGTCTLQQPNELQVIEFSEETAEVTCRQVLAHEDEIWLLSPAASGDRLLTYSSGRSNPALRLWAMSDAQPQASLQHLSTIADEESPFTTLKSALWDPHREGNVVVADAETVRVFQSSNGTEFKRSVTLHVGQRCNAACLDPHHPQQVSTVDDVHLKTWDMRQSRVAYSRDGAHNFGARDVDYNPNVPYQVVTAGEDSVLRFWDLRNLQKCKQELSGGHHHWTLRARHNHSHDQLLLSCGSDSAVCLWRAGSVASAPLGVGGGLAEGDSASGNANRNSAPDGLVKRYEEHDDSCYSCCWSASDAWIFASISYDGKLVINRVPDEEKYRILL